MRDVVVVQCTYLRATIQAHASHPAKAKAK